MGKPGGGGDPGGAGGPAGGIGPLGYGWTTTPLPTSTIPADEKVQSWQTFQSHSTPSRPCLAGAAIAALGALLALVLGVSRITLAMARDHHLPNVLAAVHPRFAVPHRAELAVGAVVAVLAATVDIRGAIGFSSFGVLVYYAIANAAAWTLSPAEVLPARIIPIVGLAGCLILAVALPPASALTGAAVIALGAVVYGLRRAVLK